MATRNGTFALMMAFTRMEEQLEDTLRQHGLTQNTATEQVSSHSATSERVVDEQLHC